MKKDCTDLIDALKRAQLGAVAGDSHRVVGRAYWAVVKSDHNWQTASWTAERRQLARLAELYGDEVARILVAAPTYGEAARRLTEWRARYSSPRSWLSARAASARK